MGKLGNRAVCNLCRHAAFEPFAVIPHLNRRIVRCLNCGLVFVNPVTASFLTFDFEDKQEREGKYVKIRRLAENEGKHEEDVVQQEDIVRTLHFGQRRKSIEDYLKPVRLLDIGCGRGFFLATFVGSGVDYFGIEPRRRIWEEAGKRVGEDKIFCGTLKEASLPDSHFDVVTMINLIEHLPCPKETLEEVNRIVKDRGLLYIETPNVGSVAARILGRRWHAFLEPEHHFFFSIDTLATMLTHAGFKVQAVKKGNKLFSIRYALYRLSWYSNALSRHLKRLLGRMHILDRTIRIPQPDELIVIAKKVTTPVEVKPSAPGVGCSWNRS
jgi:2-polyprenyl-3-methyl-5-hydroxy-6-metoxy-1,4-benzoquinol methylase